MSYSFIGVKYPFLFNIFLSEKFLFNHEYESISYCDIPEEDIIKEIIKQKKTGVLWKDSTWSVTKDKIIIPSYRKIFIKGKLIRRPLKCRE